MLDQWLIFLPLQRQHSWLIFEIRLNVSHSQHFFFVRNLQKSLTLSRLETDEKGRAL
jgi:hypothetical protein